MLYILYTMYKLYILYIMCTGKVASILPSELTHQVTDRRMPAFPTDYGLISK